MFLLRNGHFLPYKSIVVMKKVLNQLYWRVWGKLHYHSPLRRNTVYELNEKGKLIVKVHSRGKRFEVVGIHEEGLIVVE